MRTLLSVLQVLLALVFMAHGVMLLFPPAAVAAQMNAALPRGFQIFLGVAEAAAAVGLTVPGITGIQPRLVSWAAAGVMVVMVSATIFHLTRGEGGSAIVTAVLLLMATCVAYGRWRVMPFRSRSSV
jgi:uncharacterized membrane protein YphA (DoxX/SURF4 family)